MTDEPARTDGRDDWRREVAGLDAALAEQGFVRIGRIDDAVRRSLWLKEEADAFELRAGREGDDAFVRVTRDNPQWHDLHECVSRARYAAEWEDKHGFALNHAELHRQIAELIAELTSAIAIAEEAMSHANWSFYLCDKLRMEQRLREMKELLGTSTEPAVPILEPDQPGLDCQEPTSEPDYRCATCGSEDKPGPI